MLLPAPTDDQLRALRGDLRRLAPQHPSPEDQLTFKQADDALELLGLMMQPQPDRDEITMFREYYLDMEMSLRAQVVPGQRRKTVEEICKAVAATLKDTAFGGVGWGAIKKLHDRMLGDIKRGDRGKPWWWPPSGTY